MLRIYFIDGCGFEVKITKFINLILTTKRHVCNLIKLLLSRTPGEAKSSSMLKIALMHSVQALKNYCRVQFNDNLRKRLNNEEKILLLFFFYNIRTVAEQNRRLQQHTNVVSRSVGVGEFGARGTHSSCPSGRRSGRGHYRSRGCRLHAYRSTDLRRCRQFIADPDVLFTAIVAAAFFNGCSDRITVSSDPTGRKLPKSEFVKNVGPANMLIRVKFENDAGGLPMNF